MLNLPIQIKHHVTEPAQPRRPVRLAIVSRASTPVADASFSALEWLIIAVSANSPYRSLRASRLAPLLTGLHGRDALDPSAPLGALASMAANSARLGWSTPPCEMAAFLRAGWSDSQLELLVDTVERLTR